MVVGIPLEGDSFPKAPCETYSEYLMIIRWCEVGASTEYSFMSIHRGGIIIGRGRLGQEFLIK